MKRDNSKPKCAEYKVWLGNEVEGHVGVGKTTLFVRDVESKHYIRLFQPELIAHYMARQLRPALSATIASYRGVIERIWFCKEFRDWQLITRIVDKGIYRQVCVEYSYEEAVGGGIPQYVLETTIGYIKITDIHPSLMRCGNHICVGPNFSDESFILGGGNVVTPEQYGKDRPISIECVGE